MHRTELSLSAWARHSADEGTESLQFWARDFVTNRRSGCTDLSCLFGTMATRWKFPNALEKGKRTSCPGTFQRQSAFGLPWEVDLNVLRPSSEDSALLD